MGTGKRDNANDFRAPNAAICWWHDEAVTKAAGRQSSGSIGEKGAERLYRTEMGGLLVRIVVKAQRLLQGNLFWTSNMTVPSVSKSGFQICIE